MDNLIDMLTKLVTTVKSCAQNNKGLALTIGAIAGVLVHQGTRMRSLSSTADVAAPSDSKRKKSMLYTRTGDQGMSSLYNGERRAKTDPIFDALGEQDELCAAIGIAREYCHISQNGLSPMLIDIQSRLFDLGACVATPRNDKSSPDKIVYTTFSARHTEQLEAWIDALDAEMNPLTTFIIPSGGLSSTHLHMARVVCRRAERAVFPLVMLGQIDQEVGRYLNRLSDLLFAAARVAASREGHAEIPWKKAGSS